MPSKRSGSTGSRQPNRYAVILGEIFRRHYEPGMSSFFFTRDELKTVADDLEIKLPDNLGDNLYTFRFRSPMPASIVSTERDGLEWAIWLAGRARYRFKLGPPTKISPSPHAATIKVPDATPEIISKYALTDEQSLLAKLRYNRLIDTFLGITAYSLQNHLRTTVKGMGQIEIDEIYVGVNRHGQQFVIPVQAKGGSDWLGTPQAYQDILWCTEKLPHLVCRSVAAQFMGSVIALFEMTLEGDDVRVVDEKHYKLVPYIDISSTDLSSYSIR